MIAGLTALVLAASAACAPMPGVDELIAKPELRWLMLGEMHGTAEMPAAVADLACTAAAKRRPVIVAIEHETENQPALDAFLASDGGAAAQTAFLRAPMWRRTFEDGRFSRAMLDMIKRLRRMHRTGQVRRVIAFDRPVHTDRSGERDETMGASLRRIDPGADGIVLVLVGNAHAGKGMLPFGPKPYRAAGGFLPGGRTISLLMVGDAGTAFVCMERCGVNQIGGLRSTKRGVVMTPDPEAGYDGVLELGTKTSASLPARPDWRTTQP